MLIEAGEAGRVALDRVRRIFDAVGARARMTAWWNGAAADRLLDAGHARLVERAISVLKRRGWSTAAEVSFSEFGERGSIDILAAHAPNRAIAVCEIKTALGSIEETNRVLDVKVRLAPRLAEARFGWSPRAIARLLIVPDDRTVRRIVDRHALTMTSVYPARSREARAWLRRPDTALSAIWFLSDVHADNNGRTQP